MTKHKRTTPPWVEFEPPKPDLWTGVFNYLEDFVETKPNDAEYARRVLKLYDLLVAETGDAEGARELLLSRISYHEHRGLISKQHRMLAIRLLPDKPIVKQGKSGRPEGALGRRAHRRRSALFNDRTFIEAVLPSVTQEQFAKKLHGITDHDLEAEAQHPDYANDDGPLRKKINAVLQELKPARMHRLGQEQREYIEAGTSLLVDYCKDLAQRYRDAQKHNKALTQEDFIIDYFCWPKDKERHPIEGEAIQDLMVKIALGEHLLANSKRNK